MGDGLGQQPPGLLEVGGLEDRPDRRSDQLLQILGAVAQGVAQEMDGAARGQRDRFSDRSSSCC
jgi:hypothetical protein